MELTAVAQLRRMVLEHLSRYTWNDVLIDHVYDILQEVRDDTPRYRCCVYKERAVLKNRIDMALGQDCHDNIIEASKKTLSEPERKDLPLIDVLPAACDQCPIDAYYVTDICRHCIAHKCMNNCPKKAISLVQNRAFIDRNKCIECGRCRQVCPYGAIIEIHRPCVRSCGISAISIGEDRKAKIDHSKCVACGSCRNACPFGAIDERSNIVRVIQSIKNDKQVIALVAPSIVGQYGIKISMGQIYAAMKKAGFAEIIEVGIGADITSVKEAKEYMEKVPAEQGFMTSSCCPAFVKLIKTSVPEATKYISDTDSPMISTARYVRQLYPEATLVFVGPCIAKKNEVREHSDLISYALTFEELQCMLEGKDILFSEMPAAEFEREASRLGLGFPLTAGVTAAVHETVAALGGEVRKAEYASGIDSCRQKVQDACSGKLDCTYLEGMACPNGCIDGPGTVGDYHVTKVALNRYANAAPNQEALDNKHTK